MKKIFTLMLTASFVVGVFAQRPEGVIMKASVSPVIDAEVDAVWGESNIYPIDQPFQAEVPTVDGTTWKALWDEFGIYILVECLDDQWWPSYLGDGGADYLFDKPEIYLDVNLVLDDGGGASAAGGHYQVAPGPTEGSTDGTVLTTGFQGGAAEATYSITVTEPDANYEYFIPFDALTNGDGIDITGTIGFDVTMIDRDESDPLDGRRRAVWANIGGSDESWSNMDDAGYVTFDGAEIEVYVESISIEDAVIDENNGMVQIIATVLPENADVTTVNWSVENGTGRASIDKEGVVTGIMDGTVTITALAKDGSYVEDMCTVTISNQIVSLGEINLIKNGFMNQVTDDGFAVDWNDSREVINGELYLPAADGQKANWWDDARTGQNITGGNATDTYTFSFVMRSEAPDTFYVDFEDPANGYTRYGTSTHPFSTGLSDGSPDGQSQWEFVTSTESTYYLIDEALVFDRILENTQEGFNLMGGKHGEGGVFIDSVILINNNDKALLTPGYIAVTEVAVSGDASVEVGGTIQFAAAVTPGDATLTGVRWSVVNGTGYATIDADGMLMGDSAGVVTVVATAKDDSGVTGVMDVTIGDGVGISQNSVESLKLYPNPAINELNVILTSENSTVSIYNGVGQKMDEVVVSGTQHKFNISSYAAGIYFVKTETSVAKFVK